MSQWIHQEMEKRQMGKLTNRDIDEYKFDEWRHREVENREIYETKNR